VLVYGFTTEAQFQLVVRRFHNFGSIVDQRVGGNWAAFQYESLLQTEKALCQQHCLLVDGIVIGTTRLTVSLRDKLDWNSASSSSALVPSRLLVYEEPRDDEVLLLGNGSPEKKLVGRRNACDQVLSWIFGW
jgi:hypothetical protein